MASREQLLERARETGWNAVLLEKVLRLLDLLGGLRRHPYLRDRWALKGGTALNLFLMEVPRVSVDVDLNYIGARDAELMRAERPKVEQALKAVFGRHGLSIRRAPDLAEHAGGKWSLRYESVLGGGGNLEVDLNYLLREPLWAPQLMDSRELGGFRAEGVPVLDVHELAGGKLAALLSRHAARDLFDAHRLLTQVKLDARRLRIAFVAYGAMNRKDWRTVKASDVDFEARELQDQLLPLLRGGEGEAKEPPKTWASRLVSECRFELKRLLPLKPAERKFLDALLDDGEILPALLTRDAALAERLKVHPGLAWKALNVRKHRGKG